MSRIDPYYQTKNKEVVKVKGKVVGEIYWYPQRQHPKPANRPLAAKHKGE